MYVKLTPKEIGQRISRLRKMKGLSQKDLAKNIRLSRSSLAQIDLPFYYNGQLIETDFAVSVFTTQLNALGKSNGYQHLWLNGKGRSKGNNAQITWLVNNRFYTLTALTDKNTEILFATIGAGDPNFNLRNEHTGILREENSKDHLFINVIEPHGEYNPVEESTKGATSQINLIKTNGSKEKYIKVVLILKNGKKWEVSIPSDPVYAARQLVTLTEISNN